MDSKRARTIARWGTIPQMTMIACFIASGILYHGKIERWSPFRIPDICGSLLFLYCLDVLYIRRQRITGLITSGPFKYTRHPMYTGLFLMNLALWLPTPASSSLLFYALQGLFLTTLVIAGGFQEKETLARFGSEAETYYRRTPRLFFMYPFRKRAA